MLIVLILFSSLSIANSSLNLKWEAIVREVSRKYDKEGYPKENVDAYWASPIANKKSELLAKDVVKEYRHMHAMVVAAFFCKKKRPT